MFLLMMLLSVAEKPAVPTLEAVQQALAERAKNAPTQRLVFDITQTIPKGSKSEGIAAFKGRVLPTRDLVIMSRNNGVDLAGQRYRKNDTHPVDETPTQTPLDLPGVTECYDGQRLLFLNPGGVRGAAYAVGVVAAQPPQGMNDVTLLPIILTYCREHPADGSAVLHGCQPTGTVMNFDGHSCVEFTRVLSGAETRRYFIDSNVPHLVRRVQTTNGPKVFMQLDLRYTMQNNQPELAGWTYQRYSTAGVLTQTTKYEVTKLEKGLEFPANHFELTFPEGCIVQDQRVQKEFRATATGTLEEVDPRTGEPNGEATRPDAQWDRYARWLLAAGVLVVLLFVGRVAITRRRRQGA